MACFGCFGASPVKDAPGVHGTQEVQGGLGTGTPLKTLSPPNTSFRQVNGQLVVDSSAHSGSNQGAPQFLYLSFRYLESFRVHLHRNAKKRPPQCPHIHACNFYPLHHTVVTYTAELTVIMHVGLPGERPGSFQGNSGYASQGRVPSANTPSALNPAPHSASGNLHRQSEADGGSSATPKTPAGSGLQGQAPLSPGRGGAGPSGLAGTPKGGHNSRQSDTAGTSRYESSFSCHVPWTLHNSRKYCCASLLNLRSANGTTFEHL